MAEIFLAAESDLSRLCHKTRMTRALATRLTREPYQVDWVDLVDTTTHWLLRVPSRLSHIAIRPSDIATVNKYRDQPVLPLQRRFLERLKKDSSEFLRAIIQRAKRAD